MSRAIYLHEVGELQEAHLGISTRVHTPQYGEDLCFRHVTGVLLEKLVEYILIDCTSASEVDGPESPGNTVVVPELEAVLLGIYLASQLDLLQEEAAKRALDVAM